MAVTSFLWLLVKFGSVQGSAKEFQRIVNRAGKHGILLVSMGTMVHRLTQEQTDAMATVFDRLPQTVVWKETRPRPTSVGNNTILKLWIPQQDILAHSKTKAMFSHCGNNGAFEALYHGVPVIAIPIYADQFDVAYRIVRNGMGKAMELYDVTNETLLYNTITEVIQNSRYRDRARHLSNVYRDRPDTPAERGAFWVEYVLRHGGNRLRRAKIAYMIPAQKYLVDVLAFLVVMSLILLYTAMKLTSWIFKHMS